MKTFGDWGNAEELLGGFPEKRDWGSSSFIDEKRETDFSVDMEEKPEKYCSRDIQGNPEKDCPRDTQAQQASIGSPPPQPAKWDTQVEQAPTGLPPQPARQPSLSEEMNSFRREMKAQEKRVNEMKALLMTYYLDVDLAGTKKGRLEKEQRASRSETMAEIGGTLHVSSS